MRTLLAAFLLATALLPIGAVDAMPLAPIIPSTSIVIVKDGCGVGFHRLSDGTCRPQAKGPAMMRLFARKCPLGYRRNLLGKCRKD